jgi:hypothetical protein
MTIPFVILGFAYVARTKVGVLLVMTVLLFYFNMTTHQKVEWSNEGMRQLANYLNTSEDIPEEVMVTQWAYCPDYISPTEVGLEYYGFHKRHLDKLEMDFPRGKYPLRNPEDLILLNPEALHSYSRVWVVAFSGYGEKVEETLHKDGVPYDTLAFGPYHLYRIHGS